MKLAELLLLRGDLQKDLAWTKDQMVKTARIQEGDTPTENMTQLEKRVESQTEELRKIVVQINQANLANRDAEGKTLTELLATRDALKLRHAIYSAAYEQATAKELHYGASEIRWRPTFDVPAMRTRIEKLSTELRQLNASLQRMNWAIEV